jgi:Initiator Replication protein.
MGKPVKTLARMAENGVDNRKVVYPSEIGRAEWSLDNPPSAVGLKLLLLVVSSLGDAVADDTVHELPVSLLRQVPGLSGMSRVDLEQVLLDLAGVRARLEVRDAKDPRRGSVTFGALLSTVRIEYSDDTVLSCYLRFGDVFRDMVVASELFAVIDRTLALSMKSRYSLLLYQFLATHWRKDHQRQIKLPLAELRRVFAINSGDYSEFSDLRRRALSPAVSEISDRSPYQLTVKPYHEGSRAVAGVVLSWEVKAADKPAGALPPASGAKGGKAVGKGTGKPSASASASRPAPEADVLAFYADMVMRKAPGVSGAVSSSMARNLLSAGLVSQSDLRAANLPSV